MPLSYVWWLFSFFQVKEDEEKKKTIMYSGREDGSSFYVSWGVAYIIYQSPRLLDRGRNPHYWWSKPTLIFFFFSRRKKKSMEGFFLIYFFHLIIKIILLDHESLNKSETQLFRLWVVSKDYVINTNIHLASFCFLLGLLKYAFKVNGSSFVFCNYSCDCPNEVRKVLLYTSSSLGHSYYVRNVSILEIDIYFYDLWQRSDR